MFQTSNLLYNIIYRVIHGAAVIILGNHTFTNFMRWFHLTMAFKRFDHRKVHKNPIQKPPKWHGIHVKNIFFEVVCKTHHSSIVCQHYTKKNGTAQQNMFVLHPLISIWSGHKNNPCRRWFTYSRIFTTSTKFQYMRSSFHKTLFIQIYYEISSNIFWFFIYLLQKTQLTFLWGLSIENAAMLYILNVKHDSFIFFVSYCINNKCSYFVLGASLKKCWIIHVEMLKALWQSSTMPQMCFKFISEIVQFDFLFIKYTHTKCLFCDKILTHPVPKKAIVNLLTDFPLVLL